MKKDKRKSGWREQAVAWCFLLPYVLFFAGFLMYPILKGMKLSLYEMCIRDSVGTREYYVYTFGKQIYDWNINRYLGSLLVSIEEERLADICGEAQISKNPNINSLFIVDSEQRIVSHSNKSLIGKTMYEAINFDGMKVFQETLPASGWTVVSLLRCV